VRRNMEAQLESEAPERRRGLRGDYLPPHKRRRRGGQPGNRNALKRGKFTQPARARRRKVATLLAEIRWTIAACQHLTGRRRK